MRAFISTSLLFLVVSTPLAAQEVLHLGNNAWPPFVIEGENQGTSELIICEALRRSGWECEIELGAWADMLEQTIDGDKDGLLAVWHTPERALSLRYSRPYLTNRLVPVTNINADLEILSVADLAGLDVIMEVNAAYGDEVNAAKKTFIVVNMQGVENAMRAVGKGEADVVLVDELIARDFADGPEGGDIAIGQIALSYRELYFAVSRQHPSNQEIIAAFNNAYQSMLQDGTINRILDIDWLATDLNYDGILDFVHRGSATSDSEDVSGTVYPVGQDAYKEINQPDFDPSAVNYRVDSVVHETAEAAMNAVFKKEKKCEYDSFSARIVCTSK